MKLKKLISYFLACFCLKAAAEAVNSAASEEDLDKKILHLAGFRS